MPCVQAAAGKERDEHVRKNRRDLNEFDGVDDPVECLKIIHRPRKFDPLLNWIPHPIPTDQLYTELSRSQQHRLAEHAGSLVGTGRKDEAQEIVHCLAAFTDAPLENCLRAFVDHGSFWPSLPFSRSSSDIRDELIARVANDEENRNHILLALAWIGDSTVVELFEHWKQRPPSWRDSLYVPPQDYSREAGWELALNVQSGRLGQRRDLYFNDCTKLVRGLSTLPDKFQAITAREDSCPWCGQPLTNLFDVVPSEFGMFEISIAIDRVQVTTCEVCTAFGTVFGVMDEAGRGQWHSENSRPKYLPDDSDTWARLPQDSLTPAGKRPALFAANWLLPTTFSQLGGHPTWIQDADYPRCPRCSQTMMFLAQVANDEIENYSEGIYYAFVCLACATTATGYQQS
jgi:hypothetical protein